MRIFELRTLPEELRPQLAGLNPSLGDPPQDFAFIERLYQLRFPASDYFAVYAVERGRILSRIETVWLTLATTRGPETVVGIADVLTRPEAIGHGLARALLEEVHRRETRLGRRWALLWTQSSWGAHHLYESLGYRDIFSPPVALRRISDPGPGMPKGYRWTVARVGDLVRLEQLLTEGTRDRWGLVPRYPGSFRTRTHLGWRRIGDHRILWNGSKAIGYGHFPGGNRRYCATNEVIVVSPEHALPMLQAIESVAEGRWLSITHTTFATDVAPDLRDHGYALYPRMHVTLMAKRLGPSGPDPRSLARMARNPRFSCHRGDVF
jgi:GNAT superfamily N-acetyltransferase